MLETLVYVFFYVILLAFFFYIGCFDSSRFCFVEGQVRMNLRECVCVLTFLLLCFGVNL